VLKDDCKRANLLYGFDKVMYAPGRHVCQYYKAFNNHVSTHHLEPNLHVVSTVNMVPTGNNMVVGEHWNVLMRIPNDEGVGIGLKRANICQ